MTVDRGAIDAQLREIGEGERWWERREFRDLPHILHAEERIQGIVSGKLLASRLPRLRPGVRWLFVATDQRLICLKHERLARKQVDITPGQMSRVTQSSRIRSFQITIETPLRRYRLRIRRADAFRFTGALAPLIPEPPRPRLSPDLEPLSWIPGFTTVAALPGVAGIVSRVQMLSPPDPTAPPQLQVKIDQLEATVERMEDDIERLQQQVAFLEDLLRDRADEALLHRSTAE